MKKTILFLTLALALALCGCGSVRATGDEASAETQFTAEVQITEEPKAPARADGERFETVIILEGMEETVRYEHVRSEALGFEMDYDYESFTRRSEAERECFVSIYDNAQNPENYLELRYSAEDADTVAASVAEALSRDYELLVGSRALEGAGSCVRIEASVIKGTNNMADQLQAVYIIPAADGCRVATAHYAVEAAEGFGRRFNYMLNTLAVLPREGAAALSDEQALSAVKNYCFAREPGLESEAGTLPVYWNFASVSETEIVIVFRAYTGALNRFYIDRATGETFVTEQVPGIIDEEQRTGESFNVRDYLAALPAALAGTWQTASIGPQVDGGMAPEYYVRFTASKIVYGHLSGGVFASDHADPISRIEKTAAGGVRVQAQTAGGVQYSYQTGEGDSGVLEYYETWDESAFPELYRGGASLSRSF